MTNDSRSSNEERIYNTLDQNDKTIIGIRDNLNELIIEVIALKVFVAEQFYFLKQLVGYNTSSDNSYIKSLIEQIDYLKEEKKNKKLYYPVFIIPKSI